MLQILLATRTEQMAPGQMGHEQLVLGQMGRGRTVTRQMRPDNGTADNLAQYAPNKFWAKDMMKTTVPFYV